MALKRWQESHPQLFKKKVINHLGPDNYIGKTEKGFDFLGYRFKPQKLPEPAVQSLTRHIERARRLHEKGADSRRLRQYVQRWVSWLHGGLQGAVTENRFNQIWDNLNLKLSG